MTPVEALPRPVHHRSEKPDWSRGAVIYQIYPRSFQDSNGDGIGDLAGITQRLAHVADLGADAIWLSPFFTSPMKDFGYDVSDYRDVDPIFGTLADFDALVAEAHRLGLKVMIDQVLSHTSDQHPWFAESRASRDNPRADWYVWADAKPDGTPPNNWLSVFGGSSWEWDTRRMQYYLHNFLVSQPDLNFHHPEVQEALLADVRFWLERGVDGFRLDTVNFYFHDRHLRSNPPNAGEAVSEQPRANPYSWQLHYFDKSQPETLGFLERFRALLDEYPGSAAVGEIGEADEVALRLIAEYTAGVSRLHMCYTFDLLGPAYSKDYLVSRIGRFEAAAGGGWPCWAFSNHDVTRHISRFGAGDGERAAIAKICASLLLSLRGTISLYQGEELGLPEADVAFEDLTDPYGIRFWPEYKGRDGCRTPMVWEGGAPNGGFSGARPWLPVSPAHLDLAADRQAGDAASVLAHYKHMLAFRRAERPLRDGTIAFLDSPPGVVAFRREVGDEALLCVFNLDGAAATMPVPTGLALEAAPRAPGGGRLEGDTIHLPGTDAFFARVRSTN